MPVQLATVYFLNRESCSGFSTCNANDDRSRSPCTCRRSPAPVSDTATDSAQPATEAAFPASLSVPKPPASPGASVSVTVRPARFVTVPLPPRPASVCVLALTSKTPLDAAMTVLADERTSFRPHLSVPPSTAVTPL
ncbi:MAG: hypothetical protein BWX70_03141 [Verrucomicrobia bacterium ADurb.Bin070]|nr:MAG: hypothetical protein BWX70_03141 [Verrucomicrobia bacterium ADurb.Bin070]